MSVELQVVGSDAYPCPSQKEKGGAKLSVAKGNEILLSGPSFANNVK